MKRQPQAVETGEQGERGEKPSLHKTLVVGLYTGPQRLSVVSVEAAAVTPTYVEAQQ